MSLRSPFATRIEKGAYSAIVYSNGSLYVAENNKGEVIKENSNAATVIQAAIDSLTTCFGSVFLLEGTYNITESINLRDKISIFGQGTGTLLFVPNGTNPTHLKIFNIDTKEYVHISDLFIDGNKASQSSGKEDGIYITAGAHIKLTNLSIYNIYGVEGNGIFVSGIPSDVLIQGNTFNHIQDDGMDINGITNSQIIGNNINDCGDNGIDTEGAEYTTFTGNVITNCGGNGIELEQEGATPPLTRFCTATGNTIKDCGKDGFNVRSGGYNTIVGNVVFSAGRYGVYLTKTSSGGKAEHNVVANNILVDGVDEGICEVVNNADYNFLVGNYLKNNNLQSYQEDINGLHSQSNNNYWVDSYYYPAIEQKKRWYKNHSGGQISAGAVGIFDATTGKEYYIGTTTEKGNDRVLGMVLETVAADAVSPVLLEGHTNILKANGTVDIAQGDFLGTYTTAGIACKAEAGDMAIAIALEAYTGNDSNGVLDAVLLSPRKI